MRTLVRPPAIRPLVMVLALFAAVVSAHAAPITYTITVDLSFLSPSSFYSGSVTVPSALLVGGSAPITLFASPATQYSPTSLAETVSVGTGPFDFNSVFISPLVFTDTSNSLQFNLIVNGAAHCDISINPSGVPCETNGIMIGENANGGSATYTVSAEPAAVPEPAYGLPLLAMGIIGAMLRRRVRA